MSNRPADCDADGDGHEAAACGGLDCDDGDPRRHPDRLDRCDGGDGGDDNCSGDEDDCFPCHDRLELNDRRLAGAPVEPGVHPTLGVCAGTDPNDYFIVEAEIGAFVVVTLLFTHADGDIDLEIMDEAGTVVARSLSTNDNEEARGLVTADGPLYVRVYAFGDAHNEYAMTIEIEPPSGECPAGEVPIGGECLDGDDAAEPNDTRDDGHAVDASEVGEFTLCQGADSDDWFETDVQRGDYLRVAATFEPMIGSPQIWVYGPGGANALNASGRRENLVSSTADIDFDGAASIRVMGGSGRYALAVEVERSHACEADNPRANCVSCVDELDGHNDRDNPQRVSDGDVVRDLGLCAGLMESDFFAMDLEVGDELDVWTPVTEGDGSVFISLTDPVGDWMQAGASPHGNDGNLYTIEQAGLHGIRLDAHFNHTVRYDVHFDVRR